MTWVYFMIKNHKSSLFSLNRRILWKIKVVLKTIRSHKGTEYTSTNFNKFYKDEEVEHQFTLTYTQQQSGVSEKKK